MFTEKKKEERTTSEELRGVSPEEAEGTYDVIGKYLEGTRHAAG